MKRNMSTQARLYLASAVILAAGAAGAVFIYLTAGDVPDSALGYEVEESKRYMRDLELYGGKANVLAAEFMNWFRGLWHGRSLAFTVAFVAVVVSLGLFVVAYHMPPGSHPGDRDGDDRGGTG
jgi:hypothetical protein